MVLNLIAMCTEGLWKFKIFFLTGKVLAVNLEVDPFVLFCVIKMTLEIKSNHTLPVSSVFYPGHTTWKFMQKHFWPTLLSCGYPKAKITSRLQGFHLGLLLRYPYYTDTTDLLLSEFFQALTEQRKHLLSSAVKFFLFSFNTHCSSLPASGSDLIS